MSPDGHSCPRASPPDRTVELGHRVVIPASALSYLYLHRNRGSKDFAQSFADDYALIEPYLPKAVARILDIGCGTAGIDVHLKRRYPQAELWLLDGDWEEGPRAGWNKVMKGFSSRLVADELLAVNGERADRWVDIGTKEHLRADLVISLASWGYHYPLSTYRVTGYCIADLRTSTQGTRGKVIATYPKRHLCAWRMA